MNCDQREGETGATATLKTHLEGSKKSRDEQISHGETLHSIGRHFCKDMHEQGSC